MEDGEQKEERQKNKEIDFFLSLLFHFTRVVVCYVNTLIGWEAYGTRRVCAFDVRMYENGTRNG